MFIQRLVLDKGAYKGLSRVQGNLQARFLAGFPTVRWDGYPTSAHKPTTCAITRSQIRDGSVFQVHQSQRHE